MIGSLRMHVDTRSEQLLWSALWECVCVVVASSKLFLCKSSLETKDASDIVLFYSKTQ